MLLFGSPTAIIMFMVYIDHFRLAHLSNFRHFKNGSRFEVSLQFFISPRRSSGFTNPSLSHHCISSPFVSSPIRPDVMKCSCPEKRLSCVISVKDGGLQRGCAETVKSFPHRNLFRYNYSGGTPGSCIKNANNREDLPPIRPTFKSSDSTGFRQSGESLEP